MLSQKHSLNMGILGCGQMAQSIVKGLHQVYPQRFHFHTYTPTGHRAKQLALDVLGEAHATLDLLPPCQIYLIACKPQQFPDLVAEWQRSKLKETKEALFISIMAGVSLETCRNSLPQSQHWVRAMPNTPCRILQGATLLSWESQLPEKCRKLSEEIFQALGRVFPLQHEADMDFVTGVTGSGPAYIFEMARILQEILCQKARPHTLDPAVAKLMVQQTFLGASLLMEQDQNSFATLREQVTSKGGVTYAALQVFEQKNLEQIFSEALEAAYQRSLAFRSTLPTKPN